MALAAALTFAAAALAPRRRCVGPPHCHTLGLAATLAVATLAAPALAPRRRRLGPLRRPSPRRHRLGPRGRRAPRRHLRRNHTRRRFGRLGSSPPLLGLLAAAAFARPVAPFAAELALAAAASARPAALAWPSSPPPRWLLAAALALTAAALHSPPL